MNSNAQNQPALNGTLTHEEHRFSFIDAIDNIFYFRWHFIVIFLAITCASILYAVISTPIFTSDVLIQVEERKGTSLGALTQVANALGAQQSPVLGEIEILRSRSVIGQAVDNLKANIEIQIENRLPIIGEWLSRILKKNADGLTEPLWMVGNFAWGGERLRFEELTVDPSMLGEPLYLVVGDNKSWKLFDKNKIVLAEDLGDGKVKVENEGKIRVQVSSIKGRPGTRFRIVVYSIPSRVIQVLEKFNVNETKRQSNILKLTFENPNAAYGSKMLNEIADVYVEKNVSRRSEEAELSLKFLNEELPKLRVKLDAAEKLLNEFRSKTKTMDISSEIKELLIRATTLEKTQLELDLKWRELSVRYDPSHPSLKVLASQLDGVKAEATALSNQIARLPLVEQNYIRLSRDVQVNNQLYVSLLNNAQQLQIAKAGTTGNVAIVDRAVIPEKPSRPRKSIIAASGALIGLLLGFLASQTLAIISKVVRDPKKFEQDSGLPIMAVLPMDLEQLDVRETSSKRVFLLALEKPSSDSIESLRSLRTSLLFKLSEKPRSKVTLITSAVPAQGKSFISVNLSYLIAATGKKTLLIEADIRLSSARHYIDYDLSSPGLSSVLQGKVGLEEAIIKNAYPNMDYLPAGPTVRNPGDLLATDKMLSITAKLAEQYDMVVIDSPPLLPVHDARSLGRAADVTLFVVRQDAVTLTDVNDGIDVFNKSGNQIDGVVFNGFIPSSIRYGYGYNYGYSKYRSSKYGSRYRYGKYRSYSGYGNPPE